MVSKAMRQVMPKISFKTARLFLEGREETAPSVLAPHVDGELSQQHRLARSIRSDNGHKGRSDDAEAVIIEQPEAGRESLLRRLWRQVSEGENFIGPHPFCVFDSLCELICRVVPRIRFDVGPEAELIPEADRELVAQALEAWLEDEHVAFMAGDLVLQRPILETVLLVDVGTVIDDHDLVGGVYNLAQRGLSAFVRYEIHHQFALISLITSPCVMLASCSGVSFGRPFTVNSSSQHALLSHVDGSLRYWRSLAFIAGSCASRASIMVSGDPARCTAFGQAFSAAARAVRF